MTEDEAKKLWCPFGRTGLRGAAVNRWSEGSENNIRTGTNCIASDCMAWRWALEPYFDPEDKAPLLRRGLFGDIYGAPPPPRLRQSKTQGYCGLAG